MTGSLNNSPVNGETIVDKHRSIYLHTSLRCAKVVSACDEAILGVIAFS